MQNKYQTLESTIRALTRKGTDMPLEKDMNDQVHAGSYTSKHFEVSADAQKLFANLPKDVDTDVAEKSLIAHDKLFHIHKKVAASKRATRQDYDLAKRLHTDIMAVADKMGGEDNHKHVNKSLEFIKKHLELDDNVKDEAKPEDLDKRFATPPKDYMTDIKSDKDVDNLKDFRISRSKRAQRKLKIIDDQYYPLGDKGMFTKKPEVTASFLEALKQVAAYGKAAIEEKKSTADLAKKAPPYGEVTKRDVLVGRGVLKKHPTQPHKHVLAKEDAEQIDEKMKMNIDAAVAARKLAKQATKEKDPSKSSEMKKKSDEYKAKVRSEEVEQVDEISKGAAINYIAAASYDKSSHASDIGAINQIARTTGTSAAQRDMRDKLNKKHGNRSAGIQRAAHKLANKYVKVPATEEVEFDESKDMAKWLAKEIEKKTAGKQTAARDKKGVLRLKKKLKESKGHSGYGYAADAHFEKQSPKMQAAINMHLRKGKSYNDAVKAAKVHVKEDVEQVDELKTSTLQSYADKRQKTLPKSIERGSKEHKQWQMLHKAHDKVAQKLHKGGYMTPSMAREDVELGEAKYSNFAPERHEDFKAMNRSDRIGHLHSLVKLSQNHPDEKLRTHAKKAADEFRRKYLNSKYLKTVKEENDDGWYAHREMHGSKGISKEDWKKGWRLNKDGKRVQVKKEDVELSERNKENKFKKDLYVAKKGVEHATKNLGFSPKDHASMSSAFGHDKPTERDNMKALLKDYKRRGRAVTKEEVLDEISNRAKHAYLGTAVADLVARSQEHGYNVAKKKKDLGDNARKISNRQDGIYRATKGLAKEETEQVEEKLSDEQKKGIRTALGPKTPGNQMRTSSKSAKTLIKLVKDNAKKTNEDYDSNYAGMARRAKEFFDDPSKIVKRNAREIYKKRSNQAVTGMKDDVKNEEVEQVGEAHSLKQAKAKFTKHREEKTKLLLKKKNLGGLDEADAKKLEQHHKGMVAAYRVLKSASGMNESVVMMIKGSKKKEVPIEKIEQHKTQGWVTESAIKTLASQQKKQVVQREIQQKKAMFAKKDKADKAKFQKQLSDIK